MLASELLTQSCCKQDTVPEVRGAHSESLILVRGAHSVTSRSLVFPVTEPLAIIKFFL